MKVDITKINNNVSGLSQEVREAIKAALPHGFLRKIANETGFHYNTVKTFENPIVIQMAVKFLIVKNDLNESEKQVLKSALAILTKEE